MNKRNELVNDENKKVELGQKGFKIIYQYYTKEKIVGQYLNLLEIL